MFIQHFIIHGRYLGEARRWPTSPDRDIAGRPCSKAFFCQSCGEVFAKCPVVDSAGHSSSWQFRYATCVKCPPYGLQVPGSVFDLEPGFVEAFPLAVLQWEVERQAEHWRKKHD